MMASINQAIRDTAAHTSELWIKIAQTDYAPSALEQQKCRLVELNEALDKLNAQIESLDKDRGTALISHQRYRDSVVRRLAYRAAWQRDRYRAKAALVTEEYYEVLQQEYRAKEKRCVLERRYEDGLALLEDLDHVASQHNQAQTELDLLWENVFSRPDSEYQHEKVLQQKVDAAKTSQLQALKLCEKSSNTVDVLTGALNRLATAFEEVKKALVQGQMTGDGSETRFLRQAQSQVNSARCLLRQAKCGGESLEAIESLRIASLSDRGNQWGGPYSTIIWRDRIRGSRRDIEMCHAVLKRRLNVAREQHEEIELAVKMSDEVLRKSKENLRMARAVIYLEVAGNEALSVARLEDISRGSQPIIAAPPPYLTA
ncbi:DNA polymerase iota [Apiospora arundinis]